MITTIIKDGHAGLLVTDDAGYMADQFMPFQPGEEDPKGDGVALWAEAERLEAAFVGAEGRVQEQIALTEKAAAPMLDLLIAVRPVPHDDIAARYTAAELRDALTTLGLPTSGAKAELITRLLAAGWRP